MLGEVALEAEAQGYPPPGLGETLELDLLRLSDYE